MKSKFRVDYDDRADEIVDNISDALQSFGLEIVCIDSDESRDGYDEYEIQTIR